MRMVGAVAVLTVALTGCAPTTAMREGSEHARLLEIVNRFCAAERSPDPLDSRALFSAPVRRMLETLPAVDGEGRARHVTSVPPSHRCEPGRTWYLGGSRMFAEVRLDGESDRLDLWRGEAPLIRNILYGRKRAVGAKNASDLQAALAYELASERGPR
jgi:hypothetical protein